MDVFWKHFSLTTLENRLMWYKKPQKVLEVLEQFLINIVAIIRSSHIVIQIFVDFVRFACWILFLSGLKECLAVTFEEVKKVHEMISDGLSAGKLQVQV